MFPLVWVCILKAEIARAIDISAIIFTQTIPIDIYSGCTEYINTYYKSNLNSINDHRNKTEFPSEVSFY